MGGADSRLTEHAHPVVSITGPRLLFTQSKGHHRALVSAFRLKK
jgi:hypothetical protein